MRGYSNTTRVRLNHENRSSVFNGMPDYKGEPVEEYYARKAKECTENGMVFYCFADDERFAMSIAKLYGTFWADLHGQHLFCKLKRIGPPMPPDE